jgi:hypothetical protein
MTLQRIIPAIGIFACLFILLFPPVLSPDEYYSHLKVVGGQPSNNGFVIGGTFAPAISISRFAAFAGVATTQERGPMRVEVDAGELLRELALIAVLSSAAYLWLPFLVAAVQKELRKTGSIPPKANNALQRTEAGGGLFLAFHVLLRQPLSLSLGPLGISMSFPVSTPDIARWCATLLAVVFIVATLLFAYAVVASQMSGSATYSDVRGAVQEEVTRNASPEKFQRAVTRLWMFTALYSVLAWVSISFARRLNQ